MKRFIGSKITRIVLLVAVLAVVLLGYTILMARIAPGNPPAALEADKQADELHVYKASRRMDLLRAHQVIASYRISLGRGANAGAKQREGDGRTPVGTYVIDWRNRRSFDYLSLHISYPSPEDSQRAKGAGYSAGGNIMVHGLPNGWGWLGGIHHLWDWTDGCIAVTNAQMREIWALVPNGTPITIEP